MSHVREEQRCDPLSGLNLSMQMTWEMWNGEAGRALEAGERFLNEKGHHPWVDDMRFWALLATGGYADRPEVIGPNPDGSIFKVPRMIFLHAMRGELDTARGLLTAWQAQHEVDDHSMVLLGAALGDRELANEHAARMDARLGGNLALAEAVKACLCGAPFDLEATPNFRARLTEAGFPWPPPTVVRFPAKDW